MPRFDSPRYFVSDGENYHAIATDERKTIVMYFCNAGYETGILRNLDMCRYTYRWFNPRTGAYLPKGSFMPDVHRSYRVEQKPDQKPLGVAVWVAAAAAGMVLGFILNYFI
jgi:hypothetical protein